MRCWTSVLMAWALGGFAGASGAGEPPVNEHNLTVSRDRPFAHMDFNVVPQEQAAVLNTRPVQGEAFIPNTGRVVETRRHGQVVWIETQDGAAQHQARCARVPANTPSHVICMGQFAPRGAAPPGPPGPGPGPAPQVGLSWRSELNEPGTHVIVANIYNIQADNAPDPQGLTLNQIAELSVGALRTMYAAGGGNRVVIVTCGSAGTDIAGIGNLPAHLAGLQPAVQNGSVITFDTVGHGRRWRIMQSTVRAMLCARRAPANALDVVGRAADYANVIQQPEVALDVANYAQIIRPFLRDNAFVNLLHCFTGEGYVSPVQGVGQVRSVAGQLKTALPATVTVVGIQGICATPVEFTDTSGDGRWQQGEPIEGFVPRPEEVGDMWEVN